jgi:hypothetical protein
LRPRRHPRFVDLQPLSRQQAHVRGDSVARLQPDDIARDDRLAIDLSNLSFPQHGGPGRQQPLQRVRALLGTPLLIAADGRVDRQDDADEKGVERMSNEQRHHGGGTQQVNERTAELAEQELGRGERRAPRQPVRPHGGQPRGRLRLRQADLVCLQRPQDGVQAIGMPRHSGL